MVNVQQERMTVTAGNAISFSLSLELIKFINQELLFNAFSNIHQGQGHPCDLKKHLAALEAVEMLAQLLTPGAHAAFDVRNICKTGFF